LAGELYKEVGKTAQKQGAKKINLDDIKGQLDAFGRKRIEDTEAEFKSQIANKHRRWPAIGN
jgi:hypothetical protein